MEAAAAMWLTRAKRGEMELEAVAESKVLRQKRLASTVARPAGVVAVERAE